VRFFLGGAFNTGPAAQRAPQKPRACFVCAFFGSSLSVSLSVHLLYWRLVAGASEAGIGESVGKKVLGGAAAVLTPSGEGSLSHPGHWGPLL
jgi:hypothetical protein